MLTDSVSYNCYENIAVQITKVTSLLYCLVWVSVVVGFCFHRPRSGMVFATHFADVPVWSQCRM